MNKPYHSDINKVAEILRDFGYHKYQELRSIMEAPAWDCELRRIRNLAERIEELEFKLHPPQEKLNGSTV